VSTGNYKTLQISQTGVTQCISFKYKVRKRGVNATLDDAGRAYGLWPALVNSIYVCVRVHLRATFTSSWGVRYLRHILRKNI